MSNFLFFFFFNYAFQFLLVVFLSYSSPWVYLKLLPLSVLEWSMFRSATELIINLLTRPLLPSIIAFFYAYFMEKKINVIDINVSVWRNEKL